MRRFHVAGLAIVMMLALVVPAGAQGASLDRSAPERATGNAVGGPVDLDAPVQLFVQLDAPAVAELVALKGNAATPKVQKAHAASLSKQQAKFISQLSSDIRVLDQLRVGANGIRVDATIRDIPTLAAMSGVRSVAEVTTHYVDNSSSVPWINAPEVWEAYGDGDGVTIGVIDTGIDYYHASFGGSGNAADFAADDSTIIEPGSFPTVKVGGGYDFVGDTYNADSSATPMPDPDPLDCQGHGSHVAGSAAGLEVPGKVGAGVAPGATLYALRVFGCEGSTNVTSEAIEWAMDPNGDGSMDDHLDVINMSLGSSFGSPDDPSAISSTNAVNAGVIVVASAGNSGSAAAYVTGAPAVSPAAISVAASIDGGYSVLGIVVSIDGVDSTLEAGIAGFGPSLADAPVTGLVAQALPANGCSSVTNSAGIAGKIALISRGDCGFVVKVKNAQDAGALGVIVHNNAPGDPIAMGGSDGTITIPSVFITQADGTTIRAALDGGAVVSAALNADAELPKPELADQLADFSSRGPGRTGIFKPDLAAPGFGIVSTEVGSGDGGSVKSGTSMASPHVAGLAALLRQQHPDLAVAGIKAILQNSTVPANGYYPMTLQGTGVVRADRASALESYASPGGVSFGRINVAEPTTRQMTVEVTNMSNARKVFALSHVPNTPITGVSITTSVSRLSVGAGQTKKFNIKVSVKPSLMTEDDGFYSQTEVDGWVVLNDGSDALNVAYTAAVDPASDIAIKTVGKKIKVQNNGQSVGFVDGFTHVGGEGLVTRGTEYSFDAIGVRENFFGEDVVQFGVVGDAPWDSMSTTEVDIYVDADGDGIPESVIVAADLGILQGADPTGTLVTAVFDLGTGAFPLDWYVIADNNDHSAVLTATRSLILPDGDSDFDYTAFWYDLTGSEFDVAVGSVDLDNLVVPDVAEFGLAPGGANFMSATGSGDMLWITSNDVPGKQGTSISFP
ncbi:MAG: S8 family serine peptidase [Acidimicrobiia bacterium]|nr:S8 family serine peptidase [Acidimicrobiia bacterium]